MIAFEVRFEVSDSINFLADKAMQGSEFNSKTIETLFKEAWRLKGYDPKISNQALRLSNEYLKLFVMEAIHRARKVAEVEGDTMIEPSHLEKIIPQLLLDFV